MTWALQVLPIVLETFYVKISIKDFYNVSRESRLVGYSNNLKSGGIRSKTIMLGNPEALSFLHFNLRLKLKVHRPMA
jgi:hypothetical protein